MNTNKKFFLVPFIILVLSSCQGDKIESLENQISLLEDEKRKLVAKVDDLENELVQCEDEKDDLENEVDDLERKLRWCE